MTNPNAVDPLAVPDIWYKTQRVLRTITAFLVTAVPILNLSALAVVDYLQNQEDVSVPPWVFLALNGVIAGSALVIGLVTRLMAVPGVNEWLMKIGLGSVPKSAVVPVVTGTGKVEATVKPDPKATG